MNRRAVLAALPVGAALVWALTAGAGGAGHSVHKDHLGSGSVTASPTRGYTDKPCPPSTPSSLGGKPQSPKTGVSTKAVVETPPKTAQAAQPVSTPTASSVVVVPVVAVNPTVAAQPAPPTKGIGTGISISQALANTGPPLALKLLAAGLSALAGGVGFMAWARKRVRHA